MKQAEAGQQAQGGAGGFPGGANFQFGDAFKLFEQMFGAGGGGGGGAGMHFDMGGGDGSGGGFGGMPFMFGQGGGAGGGGFPGGGGFGGGGFPGGGMPGVGGFQGAKYSGGGGQQGRGAQESAELYGSGSKVTKLSPTKFPDKNAKVGPCIEGMIFVCYDGFADLDLWMLGFYFTARLVD